MEIQKKEQTAQMSEEVIQNNVSVEQDNVGFIINLMSSKLYKNRRAAFLREILSNAIDSNAEAKVENPVLLRIYQDENRDFHVQIRDYGVGLSEERFQKIYVNIGSSTKRKDNSQQGGFGIGRFSALSYANYASVTSFYEGIRYEYAMYHDGDSTSVPKLGEAPTDEPNGVLVDIAFKNIIDYEHSSHTALLEVKSILSLMLGRFSYFQNLYVDFDFDYGADYNINKYSSFIREKPNLDFALEKINSNLVLNKENYIFSKNTYVNGLNTVDDTAVPYLNAENNLNIEKPSEDVRLHIVVGENVYYPLDNKEISKYIGSSSIYREHVEAKIEELSVINTDEAKEELKLYTRVNHFYTRMKLRGLGWSEYLAVALKLPLGIKIPIGVLDILPNREEFIYNKATAIKILDIIFTKFLPELEKDLAFNNVKDFASYQELLDFYKDAATYESIGNEEAMLLYFNHEEKLKIHLQYKGDFSALSTSDSLGFEIYRTALSNPYQYTKDNYYNSEGNYNKIVIKGKKEKYYREFLYPTRRRNTFFGSYFFITVKGKQVKTEIVDALLRCSVSDKVFEDVDMLTRTSLFGEYNGAKVESLLKFPIEYAISAIGENGQITKRFAKGKTAITNGRNYSFCEVVRGKMAPNSLALVLADPEKLKPIQKAYLLSQIAEHPFSNFKTRYSNTKDNLLGIGTDRYAPVVHFVPKSHLKAKEVFVKGLDNIIEKAISSQYPNQRVIYNSPIELMKKMIDTMKKYQLQKAIQSDYHRRKDAASKKLGAKTQELREQKEILSDKLDILNLRLIAIESNLGSYIVPTQFCKGSSVKLDWRSDEDTWKKITVSSTDVDTIPSIKSKIAFLKEEIANKESKIKLHREFESNILSNIKSKYYIEVLKSHNIPQYSEYNLKNSQAERLALINRSSEIFTYPEDVKLLQDILKDYYEKSYDYMIKTLFVDFSDVTEVTPEFTEKYNNARKEDRGSNPREIVNIRQLFPKSSMAKGYDFYTYKNTAEGFLEAFKLDTATKRLYNPLIFIYGTVGKTVLEEENNLVNMFFYTYRHYERYITQSDVKGLLHYYSNESDTAPQFIFLDIPVTKQKFFKDIPNYIHIDDFMSNLKKYRQVRRLNTALLIESQAQGLSKFSSIVNANPNIFREHFSNKITRLALFMEKHTSKLNRSLEEEIDSFKKDMLEKALEEGLFEQNILDLYESCKNELQDMKLVLACSQDVIEGSFLSTSKPNSTQIEQGLKHFENIGWSITKNTASLGIVLINGTINTGRSYNDGSVSGDLIHPIVADFLVKTLKQRKNIIPRYEACNNSVINLNS